MRLKSGHRNGNSPEALVRSSRIESGNTTTSLEKKMRKLVSSAVTGLLLLGASSIALAQTVIVTPEQETVVREYVKKKPLASIKLPGVELNVGSTVPETVELHTIDAPDITYRYMVVDNRTVLVDPGTRKIVRVID